jgi:hypothetical protein
MPVDIVPYVESTWHVDELVMNKIYKIRCGRTNKILNLKKSVAVD